MTYKCKCRIEEVRRLSDLAWNVDFAAPNGECIVQAKGLPPAEALELDLGARYELTIRKVEER